MGVCTALEGFELSIENLRELDPVLFKFALIGGLNGSKLAMAAATAAAGTHIVRGSSVAVQVGKFIHLRILGKAIVPALKITQAALGIGMAISGVGIVYDLIVGGKALYDLAKGKKCSESESLSCAIDKAEEHKRLINSYLHLLKYDASALLQKAIHSTNNTTQQITEQAHTIKELQQADDRNKAEIEQLKRADDENKEVIEQLRNDNRDIWDAIKQLQNNC